MTSKEVGMPKAGEYPSCVDVPLREVVAQSLCKPVGAHDGSANAQCSEELYHLTLCVDVVSHKEHEPDVGSMPHQLLEAGVAIV